MRNQTQLWKEKYFDKELSDELNNLDYSSLNERFESQLEFGTGGLRALMGVGSNRLNIYTIRQATQGIVNVLNNEIQGLKSVVIGYDSRINSKRFAEETASVFLANRFKVYLFDELRPTPEVSFAVRNLRCDIGIVITASHNPKEYNGYKVYGSDGGQITLELAEKFADSIHKVYPFEVVTSNDLSKANVLDETYDALYLHSLLSMNIFNNNSIDNLKIVYTPLHGSGYRLVNEIFKLRGYHDINLVESQKDPDGNFPTVISPNPEEKESLELGIKFAQEINADVVLGTDPDCDRVGIAINNDHEFILLNGNQVGALLVQYMLERTESVSKRDAIVKTIVTSNLGRKIAESYGVTVFDTLTGFKYIGEKIKEFENSNEFDFLIGFEESYGYLVGTSVRDKDAVVSSLLIVDMISYYKEKNKNLLDVLNELYLKYGYYEEKLISIKLNSLKEINNTFNKFVDSQFLMGIFDGLIFIEDYQESCKLNLLTNEKSIIRLPKSKVIKIIFQDESWIAFRPSGTEPKIKIYFSNVGNSKDETHKKIMDYTDKINKIISS